MRRGDFHRRVQIGFTWDMPVTVGDMPVTVGEKTVLDLDQDNAVAAKDVFKRKS